MGGNTEMDLTETGWQVVDWIDLTQEREKGQTTANTVTNIWVPYNAGNFLTS
jgi:hypothetical protein